MHATQQGMHAMCNRYAVQRTASVLVCGFLCRGPEGVVRLVVCAAAGGCSQQQLPDRMCAGKTCAGKAVLRGAGAGCT
jgi:hypothetical protein